MIMSQPQSTDLLAAYFDRMQAMDPVGWKALFSNDGITIDPAGNPPQLVHDTADQFFRLLSTVFESMTLQLDHTFRIDSHAAVKWTMNVVGKNGREATAEGISTFEFDLSGKIYRVVSYWDDKALMQQLR